MKTLLQALLIGTLPLAAFAGDAAETPPTETEANKPQIADAVLPSYPTEARLKGIEGQVVLNLLVAPDGSVLAVGSQSEVDPVLLKVSLAAAEDWTFAPLADTDQPVVVRVPINFDLQTKVERLETMIASR